MIKNLHHFPLNLFFIILLLLFTFSQGIFAGDFVFSAKITTALMCGMAREIVYDQSYILSELDWALNPLFLAGVSLEMESSSGIFGSLDFQSGMPMGSGLITDSDYLNYDMAHTKTHYSEHSCITEQALLLDAQGGYRIKLGDNFSLDPFAQFSLMYFTWNAQDGYLQYPPEGSAPYTPWSAGIAKIKVYGTGIIYKQLYLIPAIGIRAKYRVSDTLTTFISLAVTPFVFCSDKDYHIFRQIEFYEDMANGLLLEPRFRADFRLSKSIGLGADISYRYIQGLIGDSYAVGTGVEGTPSIPLPGQKTTIFENGGGAGFEALRVSLSLDMFL